MGKLLISPEKAAAGGGLPAQKTGNPTAVMAVTTTASQHTAINCGQSSKTIHSGNILFCVILIVSLILSAYAFLRQTHYENRIRHLDKRILQLEEKLRLFPLAFLNSLANSVPPSASPPPSLSTTNQPSIFGHDQGHHRRTILDSIVPKIDIITDADTNNNNNDAAAAANDDDDNVNETSNHDVTAIQQSAHILQKLSLQVSDVQRLRRDVSHLKASRRGERQASVHPTDCSCPPGK